MEKSLGVHETLEAHELLTFKNLSTTKSYTMSGLAQDPELKNLLSNDAKAGTQFILSMQELLKKDGGNNDE